MVNDKKNAPVSLSGRKTSLAQKPNYNGCRVSGCRPVAYSRRHPEQTVLYRIVQPLRSQVTARLNVHTRCNLGARYRWGIEGAFLLEKHLGYVDEHTFAKHWNAMKGYLYLMRLAHLLNTLARFSKELSGLFSTLRVQAAISFIRNTLTGPCRLVNRR